MTAAPRLVIALTVASLLAVFLVYQVTHGSQLIVSVAQLRAGEHGAAVSCSSSCSGAQAPFTMLLKDDGSPQTVSVAYQSGSVPDAFREGRHVIVTGHMVGDRFVANPDSLVTKCPSKYSGGGGGA
jgi:cytochrome c-type biogenesis protein CcmE